MIELVAKGAVEHVATERKKRRFTRFIIEE
jgi:hypothetical protein